MKVQAVSGATVEAAAEWLARFEQALKTRDQDLFESLFLEESYWRDLVAFSWNLRQAHSRSDIADLLWSVVEDIQPSDFSLDSNRPGPSIAPNSSPEALEVFFRFETAAGHGAGLVMLIADKTSPAAFRASILFTQLTGLKAAKPEWPKTGRFDVEHPDTRWTEHLTEARAFEDRDPEVLIAGGGQHGVMTAAHLARLGINALIVDKHPKIGDAWRSRYESLILHQPHGMLYFSFMKYPENFPEYIPKDKLADWFDAYVTSLDLNFWTSTEFLGGTYDEDAKRWDVQIRTADGVRTMHPKHVVIATGGSETPNIPDLPGLDQFAGDVRHSSKFSSGKDYAGKKVLVVGTGTSAHDLALDVTKHGGVSTMLQRNPVIVVDLESANMLYGDYNGRQVPTDLIDMRYMSGLVYPLMKRNFKGFTEYGNQLDSELHRNLEAAGMKLTSEHDETGWFMRYFRTGGGYYINVGASDAIIKGDIKIMQFDDVGHFVSDGVALKNGDHLEYDAVLLATGYRNQRTGIERYFGKEVADRVGNVWGFDEGGEINNGWKPTAQEGLWMMIGGIPQARWYSPLVALQIKAEIQGIVPAHFKSQGHPSRTPVPVPAKAG